MDKTEAYFSQAKQLINFPDTNLRSDLKTQVKSRKSQLLARIMHILFCDVFKLWVKTRNTTPPQPPHHFLSLTDIYQELCLFDPTINSNVIAYMLSSFQINKASYSIVVSEKKKEKKTELACRHFNISSHSFSPNCWWQSPERADAVAFWLWASPFQFSKCLCASWDLLL